MYVCLNSGQPLIKLHNYSLFLPSPFYIVGLEQLSGSFVFLCIVLFVRPPVAEIKDNHLQFVHYQFSFVEHYGCFKTSHVQ